MHWDTFILLWVNNGEHVAAVVLLVLCRLSWFVLAIAVVHVLVAAAAVVVVVVVVAALLFFLFVDTL